MAPERGSYQEEQAYIQNLRTIKTVLELQGIDYAIVGGAALNAILGLPFKHRRTNGTLVDLDGLLLGPDKHTIKIAQNALKAFSGRDAFPELGLESATFGEKSRLFNPFGLLSGLHKDESGRFFLTFGSVQQEIPRETMKITYRPYAGVMMPFLPAKTTLYRFLTRGALLKPKDSEKLKQLEDYIFEHSDEEPPDDCYWYYLNFVDQVREKYPVSVNTYMNYWQFDNWLGGRISGASGFLYRLIPIFRSK